MVARHCSPGLLVVGLLIAASTGCANEVFVTSESGSTGGLSSTAASSTSTGGAPDAPHVVEIAVRASSPDDLGDMLVLLSRVDGALVESWPASALPLTATAMNGDLVTYATKGPSPRASSYRVEAGVERVEHGVGGWADPCPFNEEMHVDVHVPSLGGAYKAEAFGSPGGADVIYTLPGDLGVDAWTCDGQTVNVFVALTNASGWPAFEYVTLPYAPGTSASVTPSFAEQERAVLAFDLDGIDGAEEANGVGWWIDDWRGVTIEPSDSKPTPGGAPFHFEVDLVDLPNGRPYAQAWADFPPTVSCGETAVVSRMGASEGAIPFHVAELGAPRVDGASFYLEGPPGDFVSRIYGEGPEGVVWELVDDARIPRPAIFPAFPPGSSFGFQPEAFTLQHVGHVDEEASSYAEVVAHSTLADAYTTRVRYIDFVCPA